MKRRASVILLLLLLLLAVGPGCQRRMYDISKATRPYPHELHEPNSIDIQVFRKGPSIEIVNATARSFADFDLWINQRYVRNVELLGPGQTIRLSLWDFYDLRGDRFSAGGFWRTEPPMPLGMAQIQEAEGEPLIGLLVVPES
jgi:hypothetical protein